jgi:hypothetical protein
MNFNKLVAEMIEKKVAQGLTVDAAIAELAGELKASLIESGLYEELRAKGSAPVPPAPAVAKPSNDRNDTIATIKANLKARGFSYSVTGGRGTAWGWIHIDLMPKMFKSNEQIIKAERVRMNEAFGLNGASDISVPSSSAYYREYIERSAGKVPSVLGKPYWD